MLMQAWDRLSEITHKQTGRQVVGTSGGPYLFSDTELRLPMGSVEGLVHELCHWVIASDIERRQPNLGLCQDWSHPQYDRMVRCEELAWSLETYLFGDPPPDVMWSLLTPEAQASGSGYYGLSYYDKPMTLRRSSDAVAIRVAEAALAELERARESVIGHGELRPEGNEDLRREACQKAGETGLPVREIQRLVRAWWLSQYETEEDPNELNVLRDMLRNPCRRRR